MSKISKACHSVVTKKHSHFHWIHFVAGLILGSYFLLSKINTLYALTNKNYLFSFLQLFIYGLFFSYLFYFIFSHDNFFAFAKEIEKKEKLKEKNYIHKYLHHGKILATFLIGVIGGPIFLSLTLRFLLNNYKHKYLFIFITCVVSTLVTFFLGQGLFKLVF